MNFDLSDEQELLQDTVRQYAANECPPDARARDLRRRGRARRRAVEGARRARAGRDHRPRRVRRRGTRAARPGAGRGGAGRRGAARAVPRPLTREPRDPAGRQRRAEEDLAARSSRAASCWARWRSPKATAPGSRASGRSPPVRHCPVSRARPRSAPKPTSSSSAPAAAGWRSWSAAHAGSPCSRYPASTGPAASPSCASRTRRASHFRTASPRLRACATPARAARGRRVRRRAAPARDVGRVREDAPAVRRHDRELPGR